MSNTGAIDGAINNGIVARVLNTGGTNQPTQRLQPSLNLHTLV